MYYNPQKLYCEIRVLINLEKSMCLKSWLTVQRTEVMGLSYFAITLIGLWSPDGCKCLISDQACQKSRKNSSDNCQKNICCNVFTVGICKADHFCRFLFGTYIFQIKPALFSRVGLDVIAYNIMATRHNTDKTHSLKQQLEICFQ